MNAFEHSPMTIERKIAGSDLSLRDPDTFPGSPRHTPGERSIPHGLVVCREQPIRGALSEALLHCGVAPAFATTGQTTSGQSTEAPTTFLPLH